MQNIRDDLLAKSVRDRLEQLEKDGVIRSDRGSSLDLNNGKSERTYPFKSTFTVFIILLAFILVIGYFTDNLKVTEYIQGSAILVIGMTLLFFILGLIVNKFSKQ